MMSHEDTLRDSRISDDEQRRSMALDAFWGIAGILYAWRKFIIGMTVLFAVLSVVVSLLLPKWYLAETRLLSPEASSTNPLSAALSSNLSAAASALLGRSGGDFFRYITILSSRSMYENVVDEFDLVEVYETQESLNPRGAAVAILAENTAFPIDNEYEYLSVSVYDQEPQRAADMANYLVEELNRRNQELASKDAANYRRFVEQRYRETIVTLDSLKDLTQYFQKEYGVFDLENQATSFFEQFASIRAEAIALEIEYAALQAQFGANNARVEAARGAYEAANRKSEEAMRGQEDILPVSRDKLPEVMRSFLELEQEVLIQKSILEIIAPMYEQARFQEEREIQAVQVVDQAIPPTYKAKPKRSVIVIASTLSAFILIVLFVLIFTWWQQHAGGIIQRIQDASKHAQ